MKKSAVQKAPDLNYTALLANFLNCTSPNNAGKAFGNSFIRRLFLQGTDRQDPPVCSTEINVKLNGTMIAPKNIGEYL